MATTTWDPSNKSPSLTLSGGNLTATCTAGHSANLIRATNSQTTGKYYCEHNWTTMSGAGDEGFGICNATQSMSSTTLWLGHDGNPSNGIGNYNGLVYLNGGNFVVSFPPMTAGKLFGFAVDLTHGKLWYWNPLAAGQTNGEWNGDVIANQNPSTNTGGIDIVTAHPLTGVGSTAFFPCMDMEDNSAVGTTNFGATAYQISGGARSGDISGFSNWDGTSIGGGGGNPGGGNNGHHLHFPMGPRKRIFFMSPGGIHKRRFPFQHLPQPIKVGLKVPLKTLAVKRRKPLKVKLNRLLPQLVRPPRPLPKITKIVFRKRTLKRTYFLPKHWGKIAPNTTPVHPPIAAGLLRTWRKPRIKKINRWKAIKKMWPLPQFPLPVVAATWIYAAAPYGGGPYSSGGQVTMVGPPSPPPPPPPVVVPPNWIYSAAPYGGGPFSSGGRVINPPPVGPILQGSVVAPAGPIRVADPYISVVRSTTPPLAQTRKAVPSLQQVRTNPPKLNK